MGDGPVLCFGEALWDSLPHGLFPGGAPHNVAFHLRRLGMESAIVTAVGDDFLGEEILRRLAAAGVATEFATVRRDRPTGTVRVSLEGGLPSYAIAEGVAWDRIGLPEALAAAAPGASALVFGSLAQREEPNRRTLARLRALAAGAMQVFDANLRAPFDDPALVWELARGAHLVKLNDEEAARLAGTAPGEGDAEKAARSVARRTGCGLVCVTLGAAGAGLLAEGVWLRARARPVEVRDTVGAGDAFLAALVEGLLRRRVPPQAALERACRLAELVASRDGATPPYVAAPDGSFA